MLVPPCLFDRSTRQHATATAPRSRALPKEAAPAARTPQARRDQHRSLAPSVRVRAPACIPPSCALPASGPLLSARARSACAAHSTWRAPSLRRRRRFRIGCVARASTSSGSSASPRLGGGPWRFGGAAASGRTGSGFGPCSSRARFWHAAPSRAHNPRRLAHPRPFCWRANTPDNMAARRAGTFPRGALAHPTPHRAAPTCLPASTQSREHPSAGRACRHPTPTFGHTPPLALHRVVCAVVLGCAPASGWLFWAPPTNRKAGDRTQSVRGGTASRAGQPTL